jgi:hypothetical protein
VSTPQDPQGVGRPQQPPDGGQYGGYGPGQQPPYQQPQPQPQQPQPGQYGPPPGQYGQPDHYRAGQQPGQYTSSPYAGQPGQPYGSQGPEAYAYNPYGTPYPAGTGADDTARPAARPGLVVVSMILMIVSTLPYLLAGFVLLLGAGNATAALPEEYLKPFQDAGIDPASFLRGLAFVLLVPALLYVLFAVLSFRGSNVGRILATVLTAGFVLFAVAVLVLGFTGAGTGGASVALDLGSLAILIGPPVLALVAVILLFMAESSRFFSQPRR